MNYTTFKNLADHCFSIDGYYTTTFQPFDMPYHCHDNYELMYIVQGNCSVILLNDSQEKNETVTLFTNQFILINSGQFHRLVVDEPNTKIMNLEIKPVVSKDNNFSFLHSLHACPTLKTLLKKNPPYYKMTDIEYVQETIQLIQNEICSTAEQTELHEESDYLLQLLIHELFIKISRCINLTTISGIPYLKTAVKFIHEHYFEPDLSVNKVLAVTTVSQAYLQKLFRRQFNKSILDYINYLRVQNAAELLLKSTESIQSILRTVGFTNRQHFNYIFHKFFGISASEYRKEKPLKNFRVKDEKNVDVTLISHELKHPNYI